MKVLIAEDDNTSRAMLEKLLANAGYDVIATPDGEAAVKAYEADGKIEMVLLDWLMPGMDGIDACVAIRQSNRKTGRKSYMMMVSAKAEAEDMTYALEMGVDDFISKPYDAGILLTRVKVGIRHLSSVAEKPEKRMAGILQSLRTDHETLQKIDWLIEYTLSRLEQDMPAEVREWAVSPCMLLFLQAHVSKERLYTNKFLDRVIATQGEWLKELSESSFETYQQEHETLEDLISEINDRLVKYYQKKHETLLKFRQWMERYRCGEPRDDSPEELERTLQDLQMQLDKYSSTRAVALGAIQAFTSNYSQLLRDHIAREEETFYPFTLKYLTSEDFANLEHAFDQVEKEAMGGKWDEEREQVKNLVKIVQERLLE